ncbi:hypothetical protein JCM15124A_10560 [Prevotella falsenii]
MAQTELEDSANFIVSGRVIDNKQEPVEGCILSLLQVEDSAFVAHGLTGEDGKYSISFRSNKPNLLLRLSGFNIKQQIKKISVQNQRIDFKADYESITLKEVVVKAQKIWGSRDTLNYLVSSYMKEHDRTIGDILKQLPGITINDGIIKYQGVPINHFYIENMDVLQGRYNIATNGIRAEDVSTVQVLENHEPTKALQDQLPPESAAVNLKLKKKAKGTWNKSLNLGIGYDADGMKWSADAGLMYFGLKRQHVIYYETDNVGASVNWLTTYYGGNNLGASNMTSVIFPGLSPLGKSLRNNQHNISFSNLHKLGKTAQIHYNLTYGHDIQRQNSYSQTTYLLPEANIRTITEDISSRHTTNSATLQLDFENNADHTFLRNTLDLSGQWNEDNGMVLSNNSRIQQHAFSRNLGVSNKTQWIHRTTNGGGFEISSTNFAQTNPQALTITEDMQAGQDVKVTNMGSYNEFSLVRNVRRHHWTIAPIASLNVEYVGLTSLLTHADISSSNKGDMGYFTLKNNIGASLQYVKNNFRMLFKLPLSLIYTKVDNEPIADELTTAHRTKLLFSPSFALLWKASDHWTLSTNGRYGMFPTGWSNLLTAYLMKNYRTLNRYRVNLAESKSASVDAKIQYKNILNEFFAYLSGSVGRQWSDIMYGTTIDEHAHTVMQAEYLPHHTNNYTITANMRKEFGWHNTSIELTGTYAINQTKILRQSVVSDYRFDSYSILSHFAIDIIKGIRLMESCRWSVFRSKSDNYQNKIHSFNNDATLNISIIPNRLMFKTDMQYTRNSRFTDKRNYAFLNAGINYKATQKLELRLNFDNIFNTRTFVSYANSDFTESYTSYQLRPRSIIFDIRFIL